MRRLIGFSSIVLILVLLVSAIAFRVGTESDETARSGTTRPESDGAPAEPSTDVVVDAGPPALSEDLEFVTEDWMTDWGRRTIDLDELKLGIAVFDPRDRIRPLDSPAYETIESGDEWLVDREIGILFEVEDVARFYPLRILVAHEVVNDRAGELPYVVTYCPLCNTAVAFDRRVDGEVLRFGVSGLLRNSDLVMWDNSTDSLWQQITGEGIVGFHAGEQLEFIPTATVTWGDFKGRHPGGEVLSQETGFGLNYGSNNYVGYSNRDEPYGTFFDAELDDRFPALERVVGVRVADTAKAYPFSVIAPEMAVNDVVGGVPVAVWWGDSDAADNFSGSVVGQGDAIGTGIAFLREVDDRVLTFEPSGPVTFADVETGSTWNILGAAIDGPLAGTQLEIAIHQNEFWFAWSTFNVGSPVYEA